MRNVVHACAALGAAVCLSVCLAVPASANQPAGMSRQEIRSLPVFARPDRPGHFVGNAVRRRSRGVPAAPARPVAPAMPRPVR